MRPVSTHPTGFFHHDPSNPRKYFPEDDLRQLGASLKKKQFVPLLARMNGLIVDGERRRRAAELVGLGTLDAILLEDSVLAAEVKEIPLITAMRRADLKSYEVYSGCIEWLREHPGCGGKTWPKPSTARRRWCRGRSP